MNNDKLIHEDNCLYCNNKLLGYTQMLEDGYYTFKPRNNIGYFNEYSLRLIANFLEELNKDWDTQVKNEL